MDCVRIADIRIPVSRVVMGTDGLSARSFFHLVGRRVSSPFRSRRRERTNFDLLDGVFEAGCTAFDTARAYGDSERSLGDWLHSRGLRERVVVISKGAHPGPNWTSRLRPGEISRDLERSLKALRTDYIDLYLLHYDDTSTAVGPIVDVLNQHVAAGRIHAIGVSNWSTERIASARRYALSTGQKPFVVSSVQFSLATWRSPPWTSAVSLSGDDAEDARQWYKANDVWLLAYSSLAMGFFSRSRPYADDDRQIARSKRFGDRVFLHPDNLARLRRVRKLAQNRGISPGQVALAWVLQHDPRLLAIVGARTVASYTDAARACDVALTEAQRAWLSHDG